MSLANLFHFLFAQHISDINISIIRSLRLCCWITTSVVLFLVRCVLEMRCGWVGVVSVLHAEARLQPATREIFWRIRNTSATQSRVSSERTAFSNKTQLKCLRHFLPVEYKIRRRQSWKLALLFRKFYVTVSNKNCFFYEKLCDSLAVK